MKLGILFFIISTFLQAQSQSKIAPDCQLGNIVFTGVGNSVNFDNRPQSSNTGIPCALWNLVWSAQASVTSVTLQIEGAPDSNGAPGTYSVLASGTTFPSGKVNYSATTGYYPWMRVRVNAVGGTGNISATLSGWRTDAITINSGSITPPPPQPMTVVVTLTSGTMWTAPATVTNIQAECIGGGGAGNYVAGPQTGSGVGAGGGGGGGYARRNAIPVTPTNTYTYSIGQGGTSASGGGVAATRTIFTGDGGVQCIGAPGPASKSGINGNAGGSANTGDVTYAGGTGAAGGGAGFPGGGGGGSSAGNSQVGNTGVGVAGGSAPVGGGKGGNGKPAGSSGAGSAGSAPGGAGGGAWAAVNANTQYGGAGARGQIIITYQTF